MKKQILKLFDFLSFFNKIFIYSITIEYDNNFNIKTKKKIKLAIFAYYYFGGGVQKFTYLILKFFSRINIFEIFFIIRNNYKTFTKIENINYNFIEGNGKNLTDNLIKILINKNIDILIYQFKFPKEMNILIKLHKPKIIYINHSCFLLWIYIHR